MTDTKKPVAAKASAVKPTGTKPGPKAGAQAAREAAAKPNSGGKDIPKTGLEHLARQPVTPEPKLEEETFKVLTEVEKVFLENIAHSLIYDIFTLYSAIETLATLQDFAVEYFIDYYSSKLRPLLIDDEQNGKIGTLLDLGAWQALEGQEVVLAERIIEKLGGNINATQHQMKLLLVEATFGSRKDERPSRGESWMPSRPRHGQRYDVLRDSRSGGEGRTRR